MCAGLINRNAYRGVYIKEAELDGGEGQRRSDVGSVEWGIDYHRTRERSARRRGASRAPLQLAATKAVARSGSVPFTHSLCPRGKKNHKCRRVRLR
jgi:hypothetical protein